MIEKGNKKTIRAWVMYDWANSVYPLIISSAIFPILYEVNTSIKDPVSGKTTYDIISFLGMEFKIYFTPSIFDSKQSHNSPVMVIARMSIFFEDRMSLSITGKARFFFQSGNTVFSV